MGNDLKQRILQFVNESWAESKVPVLLSRLGNAEQGNISRETREHSGSLRAYLHDELSDALQIIEHSAKSALVGVFPRKESVADYGGGDSAIRDLVVDACRHRYTSEDFRNRIANVGKSLPQKRVGKRSSFVGKSNLVFKSPGRGSARHGLAPTWEDSGHELSCVIRGRLRFGASFDPRFHYDCDIPNKSIHLPGCHQPITVPRKRKHINIAPNDNIR